MNKTVKILGTEYLILFGKEEEYPALETRDGYCDSSIKCIIIDDMEKAKDETDSKKNLKAYQNSVLRHEIIHAFLYESGLGSCTSCSENWALNEEMVDWLAIQTPKIFKVFQELNILE